MYRSVHSNEPISDDCNDAYVSLVLDGQVKYGAPMDCGCAFIGGVVNGKYTVEVDAFGYELYRDTVTNDGLTSSAGTSIRA